MRAIGIILAGGNNKMMRELSNKRAIAAMPVAGSYRTIDFALTETVASPAATAVIPNVPSLLLVTLITEASLGSRV